MSWTSKGGGQGPWGNRNSGQKPTGTPPGGGGGTGPQGPKKPNDPVPDFDEWFRRGQDGFRQAFGGGGRTVALILIGLLVLWFASGLYRVDATEQGVVLRFGQYNRTTEAGLHYHLPAPIETVYKPNVTNVNSVEIGYATPTGTRYATGGADNNANESQMLTGDMNILDINFEVQWRIKPMEAEKFLFNVRNAEDVVKPVAESAMREVVGQLKLADILTTAQTEIAVKTQDIIQKTLDSYDAGIEVVSVNLSKPDVPDEVIQSFQDVKKAEQDRETAMSVAGQYRNEIMPKASGEAAKMEQDSLAYKKQVVARAEGDVSRFLAIYKQYAAAKDVTRKRIYLETMEDVLSGMPKVILENKQGAVPYLPLPAVKTPTAETGGR